MASIRPGARGSREAKRINAQLRHEDALKFNGALTSGERARAEAEYRQQIGTDAPKYQPGSRVRIGSGTYEVLYVKDDGTWPRYVTDGPHRQDFYEHELEAAEAGEPLSLVKLDDVRRTLAELEQIDEVKDIRDKAEAMRLYAKQAQMGLDAQNHAAEIKIRAERRAGELLKSMDKNTGTKGQLIGPGIIGGNTTLPPIKPPPLDDLGISKMQSSRWQQIAEIPEPEFEKLMEETKAAADELTSALFQRKGKAIKQRQVKQAARQATPAPVTVHEGETTRLIVGDMADVLDGWTGERFDLVIADPPYNVTGHEWDQFGGRTKYLGEVETWLCRCIEVCQPEYHLFWFCAPQFMADVEWVMRGRQLPIQSRLIWHRRNMAMGSRAQHKFVDSYEMIFHVGTRHLNFPAAWSDAWFDVQTFAVPQSNFEDKKEHPTQKPLDLIRRLVAFGSWPGERVLDPFAGSGTTGAACQAEGQRQCVLIEKDEDYATTLRRRLKI